MLYVKPAPDRSMDKILKFNDFDESTTFPMVLVTFENDF